MKNNNHRGFTIVELMVTVAIVGILASIALPAYQNYTKKAQFSEVILATTTVKSQIEVAAQTGKLATTSTTIDLTGANGGANGIDADITTSIGKLASLKTENGIITATGTADVDDKTYILTPTVNSNRLTWAKGGTCKSANLC